MLRGSAATGLRYVGFKDVGPPPAVLREVADAAHEAGLEVMLEVVSVSREEELRSLRAAREIGVDWVLGGTHPRRRRDPRGRALLPVRRHGRGPPERAHRLDRGDRRARGRADRAAGVHGVDLLAYRHATEDPIALTRAVARPPNAP